MSNNQTSSKNVIKPTLSFLEHQGMIIRTHNGAGEQVYMLTEKGESWLESEGAI